MPPKKIYNGALGIEVIKVSIVLQFSKIPLYSTSGSVTSNFVTFVKDANRSSLKIDVE